MDEMRVRRLSYRAHHRGFKEADLLIGTFADQKLAGLDAGQMDRFESLIAEQDRDLYDWIMGKRPVPPEHDHDVMGMLREFAQSAHKFWT